MFANSAHQSALRFPSQSWRGAEECFRVLLPYCLCDGHMLEFLQWKAYQTEMAGSLEGRIVDSNLILPLKQRRSASRHVLYLPGLLTNKSCIRQCVKHNLNVLRTFWASQSAAFQQSSPTILCSNCHPLLPRPLSGPLK
jgi:hypothetical protein